MRLSINIGDNGGAAFEGDQWGELRRAFGEMVDRVQDALDTEIEACGTIVDVNGNRCGSWHLGK